MSQPISPRRPGRPRKAPVCDCGQPGVLRVKSDWICDRCRALEQQMAWQSRAEATRPAPATECLTLPENA